VTPATSVPPLIEKRPRLFGPIELRCGRCRRIDDESAFSRDATRPSGRCRICKLCEAERERPARTVDVRLCATGCGRPAITTRHRYCGQCRQEAYARQSKLALLRERDRRRPSTTERGYGASHVATRRRLAPIVATGEVCCARCGQRILAGEPWDLGHVDGDRTRYAGPEHRRCNRATALHVARARRTSRSW
jgi:hypothetical protein